MNPKLATFLKAVVPILVALASIFVIAGYAASPEFHAATIASLDEKTGTVLELTAASTAASAAITLLPGDTATPIADKLAELSSYFLIVISAIYLEKYLTTITGYAAFVILIPAACLLQCLCKEASAEAYCLEADRFCSCGCPGDSRQRSGFGYHR